MDKDKNDVISFHFTFYFEKAMLYISDKTTKDMMHDLYLGKRRDLNGEMDNTDALSIGILRGAFYFGDFNRNIFKGVGRW